MTLLSICKAVAPDVGISVPAIVMASTARQMVELRNILNDVGEELARRVDWGVLKSEATVGGTGAAVAHSLPGSFSRLIQGNSVTVNGVPVRGGLSADEFDSLSPVIGTPRFFYLSNKTIRFWPYMSIGVDAIVRFQTESWNTGGTKEFVLDTDTPLLNETLFIKGGIARWRRQKGMDYPDYMAEYEAALADLAQFDGGIRSP
jgi:hypothetical protein